MWLDRRSLCSCFCCTWMPRVRRRIEEEGTAECLDQGARTEEDVVNTPLMQGRVEKKCIHRPRKVTREMDKSDSHPKRRSESVDNILDRLDVERERSVVRVIYSDTECTSDVEDSKNKASKSSESLVLQTSLECKIPKLTNSELPPKRPSNVKVKNVPQSDAVEMNAGEVTHGKYSPRSDGDGEALKTDKVRGNVNDNKRPSDKVNQSELQEGKMKHRRFLTSLVMKEPKDHGSQKSEKSDKKSKETAKQRMSDYSGIDEAGKHRSEREGTLERRTSKSNAGVSKSAKKGENDAKEGTKTAKNVKGGKGKKKQEESQQEKGNVTKDRAETEESDPKRRRRNRIGFLTKMLKKGNKKAADGDATKAELNNEAPIADDGSETSPRDSLPSTTHQSEPEEHSGGVKVPEKSHKVNFGLKLFPGDNDEEFKKKLESRMARIESEMKNGIAASQKADTVDGKPPTPPRPKINHISSLEGSLPKTAADDDLDVGPPLLPPRLIKRTPPSPPTNDNSSPKSCDGPSGLLGKDTLSYTSSSNGFPSPRQSLKTVSEAVNEEEIVMNQGDMSADGFKSPTLDSPIAAFPSNALITRSAENDEISDAANNICDSSLSIGFDLGCLDGSDLRQTYGTRDKFQMNDRDCKKVSTRGSDSYSQSVLPSETETFQRPGIDELSLLLNELDRMNSSLLKQEDFGSNRRPLSEEIKRVSTYEEDFVNAFPIRRRRNSDPDYDIPRPHRIPSLQATKEEDSVDKIPHRAQREDSNTSSRENTDSIVIEATRFFGPGMDFSFDEQKYNCLKDGGDLWGFQCENKYLIADCIASPPASESNEEPRNDNDPLMNENVCIETSESNVNDSNRNTSQININELLVDEMQGDSLHQQPSVEDGDSCILRLGNELKGTTGTRDVTLRNSNIDRACRKERSREVYEDDLCHQLELNTLMEGISISSPPSTEDLSHFGESEENSVRETAVEGDNSESHQDEETVGGPGQVPEIWSEVIESHVADVEIISTMPENEANTDSEEIIPPKSQVESAIDTVVEEFCAEDESDATVAMRPKDTSDENKSFRLSFATTETLLVEEEVLVATLKTVTTTTTSLASASDGLQAVQHVEESVEEVTLDVDQLSDDQFDSFQVQSCIQT